MEPNDPMETNAAPPRKSSNTLVIVLVAIAGSGFALLLCCGGCGYWFYRSYSANMPAAEVSANAFLDDLQAGRVDTAYASTSTDFQAAMTLNEFRDFVKRFSTLKTQTRRDITSRTLNDTTSGKRAIFKITLYSPDNATTCTVTAVEEAGQWKVQSITVP